MIPIKFETLKPPIVYTYVQDEIEAGGSGPGDEGEEEVESVDEGGDEASSNSTEDDTSSTDQLVWPSGRQVNYFKCLVA